MQKEKLPAGRTFTYQLFRICERFGQPISFIEQLDRQDLIKLIAYNDIRSKEEVMLQESNMHMMAAMVGAKFK